MVAARHIPAGVLAVGTPAVGVLVGQARFARSRTDVPYLDGFDASGAEGPVDGQPLHVVALGDSTLTGPGLGGPGQVWLRRALSRATTRHRVRMTSLAVSGARIADVIDAQLDRAIELRPDVVVVAAGGNDVIQRTSPRELETSADHLLRRLGRCIPTIAMTRMADVGVVPRVPQPLGSLLSLRSAQLGRRLDRVLATHPGVIPIDVGEATSKLDRNPDLFTADLFHANADGHDLWGALAAPALAEALGRH